MTVDFREIFQSELRYVWSTLRRLGVPERDREDLVNDVFVVIHRRLSDFDSTRPLRPWIFGIVYRCAADYRRLARHRHEIYEEPEVAVSPSPPADEAIADRRDRELLAKALDFIDYDRRAVLILHDIEGCPMKDAAAALGIPVRTGYSRLRVGREELLAAVRRIRGARSRS